MTSTFILQRLDSEWAALATRRSILRRVADWQLGTAPLRSLDDLLPMMGRSGTPRPGVRHDRRQCGSGGSHGPSWGHDPVAAALLHRARHDDLAARIILQRLVPGLMAVSGQYAHGRRRQEVTDELVSAAWTVIRTFEPGANPTFLVSRLIRACEYQVFEKGRRRKLQSVLADDAQLRLISAPDETPEALVELANVVADARCSGAIDESDAQFIARLVASPTAQDLAAQLRVTSRTIRNRRDAIVYRIRAQVAAANAA
jgi:DNA-directed RNA polymerase specialized sigma24 family protein